MSDYDFDWDDDADLDEIDLSDEQKVEAIDTVLSTSKISTSVGSNSARIDFGYFREDNVQPEIELKALKDY